MTTDKIKERHLDDDFKLPLDKLERMPTASDVGAYTKEEVDNAIGNIVVDVTSDVPMHFSVNSSGGLTITY